MLALDDPRWKTLEGGYRVPYDASITLARLERGENVWKERLQDLASVEDPDSLRILFGAVALARGDLRLGAWISNADQSEIDEDLERRDSWSELYR